MKIRSIVHALAAGAAAVAFATGASATDTLRHQQETDRFGVPAQEKAASRLIKLDGNSKYLNVTRGETVTVVKDGKSFTWQFATFNTAPFQLGQIAPKDFGTGHEVVYVAEDPRYFPGG